ncbi:unnamed protein product [Staurois parvus]|uniref:Hydrophobin n=1 Tax=Staurois parvus TaxID=386267 RepID=A0ABN9EF21_9NEOB|nr:unnamed protein product [Staurois parvus]
MPAPGGHPASLQLCLLLTFLLFSLRHPSTVSNLIIPSLLVTGANSAVCCEGGNMTANFLSIIGNPCL